MRGLSSLFGIGILDGQRGFSLWLSFGYRVRGEEGERGFFCSFSFSSPFFFSLFS